MADQALQNILSANSAVQGLAGIFKKQKEQEFEDEYVTPAKEAEAEAAAQARDGDLYYDSLNIPEGDNQAILDLDTSKIAAPGTRAQVNNRRVLALEHNNAINGAQDALWMKNSTDALDETFGEGTPGFDKIKANDENEAQDSIYMVADALKEVYPKASKTQRERYATAYVTHHKNGLEQTANRFAARVEEVGEVMRNRVENLKISSATDAELQQSINDMKDYVAKTADETFKTVDIHPTDKRDEFNNVIWEHTGYSAKQMLQESTESLKADGVEPHSVWSGTRDELQKYLHRMTGQFTKAGIANSGQHNIRFQNNIKSREEADAWKIDGTSKLVFETERANFSKEIAVTDLYSNKIIATYPNMEAFREANEGAYKIDRTISDAKAGIVRRLEADGIEITPELDRSITFKAEGLVDPEIAKSKAAAKRLSNADDAFKAIHSQLEKSHGSDWRSKVAGTSNTQQQLIDSAISQISKQDKTLGDLVVDSNRVIGNALEQTALAASKSDLEGDELQKYRDEIFTTTINEELINLGLKDAPVRTKLSSSEAASLAAQGTLPPQKTFEQTPGATPTAALNPAQASVNKEGQVGARPLSVEEQKDALEVIITGVTSVGGGSGAGKAAFQAAAPKLAKLVNSSKLTKVGKKIKGIFNKMKSPGLPTTKTDKITGKLSRIGETGRKFSSGKFTKSKTRINKAIEEINDLLDDATSIEREAAEEALHLLKQLL